MIKTLVFRLSSLVVVLLMVMSWLVVVSEVRLLVVPVNTLIYRLLIILFVDVLILLILSQLRFECAVRVHSVLLS